MTVLTHGLLMLAVAAACCARVPGAERIAIGLTSARTVIYASAVEATSAGARMVMLIGTGDSPGVSAAVRQYEERGRRPFHLVAVAAPNPDGSELGFPPRGAAYRDNPESHYLWRWMLVQAPDLVLVAGPDFGLGPALAGRVPVVNARGNLLRAVPKQIGKSPLRIELERRLSRTPREVATQLSQHYGHEFSEPVYIPGVALIAGMRLGAVDEVARIAARWVDGSRDSLAKPTASHLAGHLVFAELAERTGDDRYVARVRAAADLALSNPMHSEMSDSVFMSCPILVKAGKLTADRRYFDGAANHLKFMQTLCLRPGGLYRHSPLDDAAWGRGNAFASLGLALALSDFPPRHEAFETMLRSFQNHMAALAGFQDASGMWRQVIDVPGSYSELSATAMIGTAMARGIRRGWLDERAYRPMLERAWRAVRARVFDDGRLLDVCESTGKQQSLDDYLRRTAIFDRDARGGAMVLLLATELM